MLNCAAHESYFNTPVPVLPMSLIHLIRNVITGDLLQMETREPFARPLWFVLQDLHIAAVASESEHDFTQHSLADQTTVYLK